VFVVADHQSPSSSDGEVALGSHLISTNSEKCLKGVIDKQPKTLLVAQGMPRA
jgi:hypothetical protein